MIELSWAQIAGAGGALVGTIGFLFKLYRDSIAKRFLEKDQRITNWEKVFREERDKLEAKISAQDAVIRQLEQELRTVLRDND